MSKRYIFLAILLLGSAFGLTRIPEFKEKEQISPEALLIKINDQSRYLSTYLIAKRIIEQDPGLFLIDVRSADQYEKYKIPGAANVPLAEIMLPEYKDYMRQEGVDIVFYSNGDLFADQAWMLGAQKGISNLYVVKGGLNEWFRTIIKPEIPPESASQEEFDLYAFAKGACNYFGGGSIETSTNANKEEITVRKKTKKKAEGGC